MKRKVTVGCLFFCCLLGVSLYSESGKDWNPKHGDLKEDDKSVRYSDSSKRGCCKIKYPSGGYDFFEATEQECRNNLYFDRFLGEKNTLCFQWKD
jgi:hypothetical protein